MANTSCEEQPPPGLPGSRPPAAAPGPVAEHGPPQHISLRPSVLPQPSHAPSRPKGTVNGPPPSYRLPRRRFRVSLLAPPHTAPPITSPRWYPPHGGIGCEVHCPRPLPRLGRPRPQSPAVGQYRAHPSCYRASRSPLEARPSRAASALALCLASPRPRQAPIGAVLPVALGLASERSGEG